VDRSECRPISLRAWRVVRWRGGAVLGLARAIGSRRRGRGTDFWVGGGDVLKCRRAPCKMMSLCYVFNEYSIVLCQAESRQ